MIAKKAIVLFSGGQDSTTCLAWALNKYEHVETIGFDYGQNHRIELDCRHTVLARIRNDFPQWAERLGEDHLLEIGVLGAELRAERRLGVVRDVAEVDEQARGLARVLRELLRAEHDDGKDKDDDEVYPVDAEQHECKGTRPGGCQPTRIRRWSPATIFSPRLGW